MKKLMLVGVVLLTIGLVPQVFATPEFLDAFNATYPSAVGSKIDNCALCHINGVPGGPRNMYGTDFENQLKKGLNASDALKAIENNDSDMKGFTHIQEINNLNFPGNSSDLPVAATGFNITGFKINGTDDNEAGIANWPITLFDSNNSEIGTTSTLSDGSFSFTNLANGTYEVTEGSMQGWTNITPMTQEITIDNGDETDVNFTNIMVSPSGEFNISGFKINGTDDNGMGVENWNIMLLDENGSQIATTKTENDGFYHFTNLHNGIYTVKEGTMDGWTNVTPMTQEVTIDNAEETDVNFTNTLSSIGPLKITNESPKSPQFTSNVNEPVTFEIKLNQDANVSWNLDGMLVENEDNTMDSEYTNDNASIGQHTLDANASNQNGQDSFEWVWTVQNVAPSENIGIITGIVFNDKNHNGKKDKGENGISGINVTLKGLDPFNKGVLLFKKTDRKGRYTFKNLSIGHYRIILKHKKGFTPTTGTSRKVNLIPKIMVDFGDKKK